MHPSPLYSGWNISTEIKNLALQYGINVVMNGHDHVFEKRTINNTLYITMGLGGNNNNGYVQGYAGYMQVEVTPLTMNLTWINTYNDVREPVIFIQK
jgi:predicted phosphodiesterase